MSQKTTKYPTIVSRNNCLSCGFCIIKIKTNWLNLAELQTIKKLDAVIDTWDYTHRFSSSWVRFATQSMEGVKNNLEFW